MITLFRGVFVGGGLAPPPLADVNFYHGIFVVLLFFSSRTSKFRHSLTKSVSYLGLRPQTTLSSSFHTFWIRHWCCRYCVCDAALLCGRGRCDDVNTTSSVTSRSESVELDLLHGIVKGYSRYIEFFVTPSPASDRACSAQAVLR